MQSPRQNNRFCIITNFFSGLSIFQSARLYARKQAFNYRDIDISQVVSGAFFSTDSVVSGIAQYFVHVSLRCLDTRYEMD